MIRRQLQGTVRISRASIEAVGIQEREWIRQLNRLPLRPIRRLRYLQRARSARWTRFLKAELNQLIEDFWRRPL